MSIGSDDFIIISSTFHFQQIYEELGRFSIAAKHYASLGELYESDDIVNIELAVANYNKAAG